MYLTWQAQLFGITRRRAFLMAFFLCCAVLLFPWALRTERIIWWIVSILFFVIIGTLWPIIQINKHKSQNSVICPDQNRSEENYDIQERIAERQKNQDYIDQPQEEQVRIVEAQEDQVEIDTTLLTLLEPLPELNIISLEELIDLGFKAKHSDNFEQAAFYFSKALSLNPVPDIAFYLILDCYWLWNNLDEREYALSQLNGIIKRYLPRFNSGLSHQFNVWMTKENIRIN